MYVANMLLTQFKLIIFSMRNMGLYIEHISKNEAAKQQADRDQIADIIKKRGRRL